MAADLDTISRTFRALSDPGRRQMIDQLARGSASVSELGRPLHMSLAAVVQHIQVLEASGMVVTHKTGRVRTCTLAAEPMRAAEEWLAAHRLRWDRRLDRLGDVLDEEQGRSTPGAPR